MIYYAVCYSEDGKVESACGFRSDAKNLAGVKRAAEKMLAHLKVECDYYVIQASWFYDDVYAARDYNNQGGIAARAYLKMLPELAQKFTFDK